MSHANAALASRARLRMARLIVEEGWPVAVAAKMFLVSPPTARKWAARYRDQGTAGMVDRYLHTVIDDHSRVAYVEMHADEKAATAIGVLQRASAWFAERGVSVERVLSDNGSAYRSHAWREACADLQIISKRTRPYRPQTNGKIERFHRTLADGWAYARFYTSETERRAALPAWIHFIHFYNRHRLHTARSAARPSAGSTTCLDITSRCSVSWRW